MSAGDASGLQSEAMAAVRPAEAMAALRQALGPHGDWLRARGIRHLDLCPGTALGAGAATAVLLSVDAAVALNAYGYFVIERQIEAWAGRPVAVRDVETLADDARRAARAAAEPLF